MSALTVRQPRPTIIEMDAPLDASSYGARPLGPLRDKRIVDISAADHVDGSGFVCQVAAAGDLTYRTAAGSADQTETMAAGDTVNVGGIMVVLSAVRASAAIRSIAVGKL